MTKALETIAGQPTTRRDFLRVLAGGAASLLLPGCGGSDPFKPDPCDNGGCVEPTPKIAIDVDVQGYLGKTSLSAKLQFKNALTGQTQVFTGSHVTAELERAPYEVTVLEDGAYHHLSRMLPNGTATIGQLQVSDGAAHPLLVPSGASFRGVVEVVEKEYDIAHLRDSGSLTAEEGIIRTPRWWNGLTFVLYQNKTGDTSKPSGDLYSADQLSRYATAINRLNQFRSDGIIGFDPLPDMKTVDADETTIDSYIKSFAEVAIIPKADHVVVSKRHISSDEWFIPVTDGAMKYVDAAGMRIPLEGWQQFISELDIGLNAQRYFGDGCVLKGNVGNISVNDACSAGMISEEYLNRPEIPALELQSWRVMFGFAYPTAHPNHPGGQYNLSTTRT